MRELFIALCEHEDVHGRLNDEQERAFMNAYSKGRLPSSKPDDFANERAIAEGGVAKFLSDLSAANNNSHK